MASGGLELTVCYLGVWSGEDRGSGHNGGDISPCGGEGEDRPFQEEPSSPEACHVEHQVR